MCTGGLENDSKFHTWGPIPQGHQPRYRFKITQSGEGNNSSQINRTYPLKAQKNQKVQDQRYMNTTATLSRNGQLQVEIYSKTDKNAYGLRGGVVVTCWDDSGNLIYFCDPMWISTRCGRFDPSCDSEGIDQRNQNFPEAITRETARIEINHFVNSFHDMTKTFANGCKTTLEIAHIADDTAQEILKIVAKYKK